MSLGILGDPLQQGAQSAAFSVSGDGSTVVGWSTSPDGFQAFRWTSADNMVGLGYLPGSVGDSRANDVSYDGSVIVGRSTASDALPHACRWTSSGIQAITEMPGAVHSQATATSWDGSVIVGEVTTMPGFVIGGFLWDAANGMRLIKQVLVDAGINMTGWTLSKVTDVSADGLTIVGWGTNPQGQTEGWIATLPATTFDTDGDGLLDDWETNGIPYTDVNGTVQHYTLPGADKNHKDLYVATPAGMVEQAFANAPVANPNGSPGIALHIDENEMNLPNVAVWPTNGCWPNDFDTYRDSYFGTFNERNDDPATVAARLAAKKKAYRYCIVAEEASSGAGGCGEWPGENFVIFVGGPGFFDGLHDDEDAAAVFMHELGHNLGLGHGGGDGVNGKPNYISIMNYLNNYATGWNEDYWKLDYSRDDLEPLVENALDETQGVGYSPSLFDHWWMPFCVNFDTGTAIERQMRTVHTNGQARDFGDPQGTGFLDGEIDPLVTQDLNYWGPNAPFADLSNPSPGEVLFGHNDWTNLQLPLPVVTNVAGGKPPTYPTDELTTAQIQWINDNIPQPCFADIAPENLGDGAVDVDDLLMVINHWGDCAAKGPCQADIAPVATGDRTVNVNDLLAVINAWGPCR
jgi:hypothetical protein